MYLASRDRRVPLAAKLVAAAVAAYALSPIDLIPDFIPVLGYLDDLILVPAGIALAIKLVPPHVLADCRAEAGRRFAQSGPTSRVGAVIVVVLWVVAGSWLAMILAPMLGCRDGARVSF